MPTLIILSDVNVGDINQEKITFTDEIMALMKSKDNMYSFVTHT